MQNGSTNRRRLAGQRPQKLKLAFCWTYKDGKGFASVAVLAPQASASASSATTASPSILKCGSRDCQMMGAERQLVCAKRDAAMDCLAQSANYRATSGLVSGLNGWLRGFGWGGGVGRGGHRRRTGPQQRPDHAASPARRGSCRPGARAG